MPDEAEKMQGASPADGETVYTAQGSITEHKRAKDQFDLTPEMRKRYGVKDEEVHAYIRNPSFWEEHEGSDRILEFEDEHPGARIPKTKDGKAKTSKDLILVAYPRAQREAREAEERAQYAAWIKATEEGTLPGQFDFPRNTEEGKRRALAEHERNIRSGMIGGQSPTSGLSYPEALARYSEEDVEAEETRFRRGPRRQTYDDKAWAEQIDKYDAAKKRGQSFAFGNTGFARNPNAPVAQAAAREKGAAAKSA